MKEMHVNDIRFAEMMARWCYQSDLGSGRSGGRTSDDPQWNSVPGEVASMKPFRANKWFSRFKNDWKKQKHFGYAKPLLSRVYTAMAAKHGKDFLGFTKSMHYWYFQGLADAKWMKPYLEKLLDMNRTLILYGRDCMAPFRAMYGVQGIYYIEGMSRPVSAFPAEQVKKYIESIVPKYLLEDALHVDTGFAGSIPKRIISVLNPMHWEYSKPNVDDNAILFSSQGNVKGLRATRERVLQIEYRPKFFFRPTEWTTDGKPRLHVSGDAHNAAAYTIGVMAGTQERRLIYKDFYTERRQKCLAS